MSTHNTNFSTLFNSFKSVFKNANKEDDGKYQKDYGEVVFSSNYIPPMLHHREEEMKSLVSYFRSIITNPLATSKKVVLYGPVGTGKTLASRAFGNDIAIHLKNEHKIGDPVFRFFHVNCRKTKTPHLILTTILRQLIPGFPLRGFGVDELLRMFTLLLFEQNLVTLLVLDEIDYLIDDRTDFLYSLSRIEESPPVYESHYSNPSNINTESRFSLLMITRDKNFRHYLDSSTASSLGRNFIFFPPYTRNQLFDIVYARAKLGLREECYNDELLEVIASLAEEYGDARFAIELLWKAGKIADKENVDCIVPEHVRKAIVVILPMEKSMIEELNSHQQLILLSVAKLLTDGQTKVTTPEVKQYYQQICEEANIRARRPTQVWAYLKDLSRLGLIKQEVENRHNQKGRSLGRVTTIKIRDIPVTDIIQSLNHLIED